MYQLPKRGTAKYTNTNEWSSEEDTVLKLTYVTFENYLKPVSGVLGRSRIAICERVDLLKSMGFDSIPVNVIVVAQQTGMEQRGRRVFGTDRRGAA